MLVKHPQNAAVLLLLLCLEAWKGGPRKESWVGRAQNNSRGHLGASGSGAESPGCCRHGHSDLGEKAPSALTTGKTHDGARTVLAPMPRTGPNACPWETPAPRWLNASRSVPSQQPLLSSHLPKVHTNCSSSGPPPCLGFI